jgi:hypothetical protein
MTLKKISDTLNFHEEKSLPLGAANSATADAFLGGYRTYFQILAATYDNVEISINNGANFVKISKGVKYKAPEGQAIAELVVRNKEGSANTVVIAQGIGDMDDNRLVIGSTVSVDIIAQTLSLLTAQQKNPLGANAVTLNFAGVVGTTTTDLIAAAANVSGIWLRNLHAWLSPDPTNALLTLRAGASRIIFNLNNVLAATNPDARYSLPYPIFIEAGVALVCARSGTGSVHGTYD